MFTLSQILCCHTWNVESDTKKTDYESIILKNIHKYPLIVVVNNTDSYNYLKKYENNYTKIYQTDLIKNNLQLALNLYNKYKTIFDDCDDGITYKNIEFQQIENRVD